MPIRAALPSLKEIRADDYVVYIAYAPPLITDASETEGGQILRELKEKMTFSVCRDFAKCFAWIYGGVSVYRRGILIRKEVDGYVKFSNESCESAGIENLLTSIDSAKSEWCVRLGDETLQFSKKRREGFKWVDNVGLRFLVL